MVHARTLNLPGQDPRTLTFIVSGKLWRNGLVMQDKETNSLWSHITGECLDGDLKGTRLDMVPVVQTTWKQWRADHPDTRVLKKSEEISSSRYERYFADPERTGMFRTTWLRDRLPGKSLVQGIRLGPHAAAVSDAVLTIDRPAQADLGGVIVSVTRDADGGVRATRQDTGEELVVLQAFWFAWSTYFPRTTVID